MHGRERRGGGNSSASQNIEGKPVRSLFLIIMTGETMLGVESNCSHKKTVGVLGLKKEIAEKKRGGALRYPCLQS